VNLVKAEKKKEIEEAEAERIIAEKKKVVDLRKGLKEVKKEEQIAKGEIVKEAVGGMVLKEMGVKDQDAMDRLHKKMNANEDKLKILKAQQEKQAEELAKIKHRNRESSQIYQDNKDLFKRKEFRQEEEEEEPQLLGVKVVEDEVKKPDFRKVKTPKVTDLYARIRAGESLSEDEIDYMLKNHVKGVKIPYFTGLAKLVDQYGISLDDVDFSGGKNEPEKKVGRVQKKLTPEYDAELNKLPVIPDLRDKQKIVQHNPYVDNIELPKIEDNQMKRITPFKREVKKDELPAIKNYQPLRNKGGKLNI